MIPVMFKLDIKTTLRLFLGYFIIGCFVAVVLLSIILVIPFGIFDSIKRILTNKRCVRCDRILVYWITTVEAVGNWLQPKVYKIAVSDKLSMWIALNNKEDDDVVE